MQCPSCQNMVPDNSATCPTCGWGFRSGGGAVARTIVRAAARPKLPVEVEFAADIDRTGSSLGFKTGIERSMEIVVRSIVAKACKVTVWVVSHGDLDLDEQPVVHTAAGTPDQAIADVKGITFSGGGDAEEHHLDGIEYAFTTTPWTLNPRKARGALIAFLTDDTKPLRSGKSARQLGEEIRSRGILVYLVCQETPTLREFAEAAGGMIFAISNTPSADELAKVSAQVAASITATVGAGSTVPLSVTASSSV